MMIKIPAFSLVLVVGLDEEATNVFAAKQFKSENTISTSWDVEKQQLTNYLDTTIDLVKGRLDKMQRTVLILPDWQHKMRQKARELSKIYHVDSIVIIYKDFNNALFSEMTLKNFNTTHSKINKEGHAAVFEVIDANNVNLVEHHYTFEKRFDQGPFDLIGDIHGCWGELQVLLNQLGYNIQEDKSAPYGIHVQPPLNRKVVFVGDLCDRGPNSVAVLKLVMSMVESGTAYCVCGNHDFKLYKYLSGERVNDKHGFKETRMELEAEPPEFSKAVKKFIKDLPPYLILDNGNLVVAHAGLREQYHGRYSNRIRNLCMYGEIGKKRDKYDLPIRYNWAKEHTGDATIIYGHVPVTQAEWFNNTMDIDTACCFGGSLTALKYPEKELISVPCIEQYAPSLRPLKRITEQ